MSFSSKAVSRVEYYIENADEAHPQVGRDATQYYTDTSAGEPPGVVFTPKLRDGTDVKFRFGQDGTVADPKVVRSLSEGVDPATGKALLKASKNRKMAYDNTFCAPKSVAALWVCGDEPMRVAIERAQTNAVNAVMQYAHDQGYVISRTGKGGANRIPAEDWVGFRYRHHTTRAGDPLIHDHFLLCNLAQCDDGKIRTLDNARMRNAQKAFSNIYRAALADELQKEMAQAQCPISIIKDDQEDKGFHIIGVPETLCETWSKRTKQIEDYLEEHTGSSETKGRGGMSQVASHASRGSKSEVPKVVDLDCAGGKWEQEISSVGWSKAGVIEAVRQAGLRERFADERAALEGGMSVEQLHAQDRKRAIEDAMLKLAETKANYEEKDVLKAVFESLQGKAGLAVCHAEVQELIASGRIKEIGRNTKNGERVFADDMIEIERQMLLGAVNRKGERAGGWVPPEVVEKYIAKAKVSLSNEQGNAVRHALNGDGVSIVQGRAGAGKSTSMEAVAMAARELGFYVRVCAPSWKATGVIAQDVHADETAAKALQGFIARLDPRHKDCITLTKDDLIIVDEAGMIGTKPMAILLEAAGKAGAKVVLTGDVQQIQAVEAGCALKALALPAVLGSSDIEVIRRQMKKNPDTGELERTWMCDASEKFAKGKGREALEMYDNNGFVTWADRDECIDAMVADVKADLIANPNGTRLVITGWNTDVRACNEKLRSAYKDVGIIHGQEFEVPALTRDRNPTPTMIKIAVGERLIFGETLRTRGPEAKQIATNSSFGTVLSVTDSGEKGNPFVKIQIDKGKLIEAKWLDLQGPRSERDDPKRCLPKIAHAYCCTTNASQGSTVDRAYLLNLRGMGMSNFYVGCTRHREECRIYIDKSRVEEALQAQREELVHHVGDKGHVKAKDDDDPLDEPAPVELADVKKSIAAEIGKSDGKTNCCDYAANVDDFIHGREQLGPKMLMPDDSKTVKSDERWFYETGGYDALSNENQAYAAAAHFAWQASNPERNVHSLESYVGYVQSKHIEKETKDAPYDDTRQWSNKPEPWYPHRAVPDVPPLTPEQLRVSMCGRLADQVGFDMPKLAGTQLPSELVEMADRHRARLAAEQALVASAPPVVAVKATDRPAPVLVQQPEQIVPPRPVVMTPEAPGPVARATPTETPRPTKLAEPISRPSADGKPRKPSSDDERKAAEAERKAAVEAERRAAELARQQQARNRSLRPGMRM